MRAYQPRAGTPRVGGGLLPRIMYLLTPVLALALLPSNVVVAALPVIREEWGTNATAMGWVYGAYQAGYVAAVLLILPLTDRVPAGRVILACTVGTLAAFLAFPFLTHDVTTAVIWRMLAGAGLAGIYMPGV